MSEIILSGAPQGKRLEYKRLGFRLAFAFAPDASSCTASYHPSGGGPPLSDTDLQQIIQEARITAGLREEAVQELLQQAGEAHEVHDLLLAHGSAMIPGADGRIALNRPAEAPADLGDDSERQVDFHQVQEFLNTEEGEVVATIVAAGKGTPGLSVFGAPIPASDGKAATVKLGKNVTLLDDATHIVATAAGRVFAQNGEVSVEDVYQVSGDVDFKVGNIDFNGYLEVTGDVLDGFRVRASKGIKVLGNVGACNITSDGDISFCGMNGHGMGIVLCGGTLRANFIYEARVEAVNDVLVESEIRHCGIRSMGAVRVNKGGIVGGECVALAGIEVGSLGCVTSLHTRVVVGVSYRDLEEMTQRFDELRELTNRQNRAQGSKGESDSFLQARSAITALIREIRQRKYQRANPKVNVRKMLHGGVTVSLDTLTEEFREEREGPFSMIENKVDGGLRFLTLSALPVEAGAIEAQFMREAQLKR